MSGISAAGLDAETLFLKLTGAARAPRAALGDAALDGEYIEIKQASTSTLNQVRALKYLPLVVLDARKGDWYVIPPHIVVALVAQKRRGQHTENPFESATLSLKNLAEFRLENESELRARTVQAIEAGRRYPELRARMIGVLEASRRLAEHSVRDVRAALAEAGLVVKDGR